MAFGKKVEIILSKNPDILIVPECEHPNKLTFDNGLHAPNDIFWHGENPNKGLGLFSYGDLKIKILEDHNKGIKHFIPVLIEGNNIKFFLLAVWCKKSKVSNDYVTYTWDAIQCYKELLMEEKVMIAGDFNSNSIWDKRYRKVNHSRIVEELKAIRLQSTYHFYHEEIQGKESRPTLFLHRKIDRPYHIDFCFASDFFIQRLKNVEVGTFEDWMPYSDHCPLMVDYEI